MKNTMKRLLALMLVLVTLCAYLVPGAAAAEDTATLQKAILETALAYHYKGKYVQYDSTALTIQPKNEAGIGRMSTNASPEDASADNIVYSVCSDYCYDVYYNVLGYKTMGSGRETRTRLMTNLPATDPVIVVKYGQDGMQNREEALKKAQESLQPGDIVVGYGDSGHAMLWIGDYKGDGKNYIIHCWGGKMDGKTGRDSVETSGAIRIEDADKALFSEKGTWCLTCEKHATDFVIMRPLNDPACSKELTASGKARLKYPGIEVDRTCSPNRYNSAATGDEITMCVAITNNSAADYTGLAVHENLPVGAEVVESTVKNDGKLSATGIDWTVDVAAGKTVKLYYRIKVTAAHSEYVTMPAGTVDALPTREIKARVSGKELSKANQDKLEDIADGKVKLNGEEFKDKSQGAFANQFYKSALGIELNLPATIKEMQEGLCEYIKVLKVSDKYNNSLWTPIAAEKLSGPMAQLQSMVMPESILGFCVYLGKDPMAVPETMAANDRMLVFDPEYFEPGDVVLYFTDPDVITPTDPLNTGAYVYLGDETVAAWDPEKGIVIEDFDDTISLCIKHNFVLNLRPTMGFNDVNTSTTDMPFTDVKAADWFCYFVKELYEDKVVAGQTATTFNPGGNLTYAAALKLLVVGLTGKDAGNAASGHWATNYLNEAVTAGWTAVGADKLDAPITREAFCEIAAKAKNLTEQPAENKFTDTQNTSVLALVKAGVINGMSETTFAPANVLTRAQISKIISLLLKL